MSAERHALSAALDYSDKQAQEINNLKKLLGEMDNENYLLKNKLRVIKETVNPQDCYTNKTSSYQQDNENDPLRRE